MHPPEGTREVTRLLGRIREGDEGAAGQLLPLVYGELHAGPGNQRGDHALQPTALVHEAWLCSELDGAR